MYIDPQFNNMTNFEKKIYLTLKPFARLFEDVIERDADNYDKHQINVTLDLNGKSYTESISIAHFFAVRDVIKDLKKKLKKNDS